MLPFARSQTNSAPLNDEEKRQVIELLLENKANRKVIILLQEYITKDEEQDAKEKELYQKQIELEKKTTELAIQERDLYKDKYETYKLMYDTVTKKPRVGCRILRPLTLWIYQCN